MCVAMKALKNHGGLTHLSQTSMVFLFAGKENALTRAQIAKEEMKS
jgi:hypothetical protein